MQRRSKYKKDHYGHIVGEVIEKEPEIETSNVFDVLNQEKAEDHYSSIIKEKESTKDQVNKCFRKADTPLAKGTQISNEGNKEIN